TAFIEEAVELTGAFLVLDIDNFKYINDTYGHQKGDEVLKTVSEVLTVTLRTSDIISRMGGDEFAVYLKDLPSEALAINLAKVICDRVASVIKDEVGVTVTCSIGISIAKSPLDSYEMLYKEADCALYHAKHLGKNQSVIYTAKLKEEIGDEKGL
ncbi:MAG: GGDEF domain-containing protein, partial [Oscillospiraceae bacterium]